MTVYVYNLIRLGESVPFYIGITENKKKRIEAHHRTFGKAILFSAFFCLPNRSVAERLEGRAIAYWESQGVRLGNNAKTSRATLGCRRKLPVESFIGILPR